MEKQGTSVCTTCEERLRSRRGQIDKFVAVRRSFHSARLTATGLLGERPIRTAKGNKYQEPRGQTEETLLLFTLLVLGTYGNANVLTILGRLYCRRSPPPMR